MAAQQPLTISPQLRGHRVYTGLNVYQSMGVLLLSVVGFALESGCLGVLAGFLHHSLEATDDLHVHVLMETRVADLAKATGCQPAEVMDPRDLPNTSTLVATTPSSPLAGSIVAGFPCRGNPGRPRKHFKDTAGRWCVRLPARRARLAIIYQ